MLRRHLRERGGYDVVLHYNLEWLLFGPTVARLGNECPIVVEYEDDALSLIGARLKSWHLRRGRKAIAAAKRLARGVIAVNPELGRQLELDNAEVIPGVVGDDLLGIERGPSSTAGPLRIVYTGGITHAKGPGLLVEATNLLEFPVEVDIVGGGVELAGVRDAARGSRWPLRVHGELSRSAMVELVARANLAVNPHRLGTDEVGQVFPFKMLDYAAAGLPIVSSKLGECPRALESSVLTYRSDTSAALAAALGEARGRLVSLSASARATREWVAAEFSRESVGRKVERVLLEAVRTWRSGGAAVAGRSDG